VGVAKIIRERVITDTIEVIGDTVKKLPKPPEKSRTGCLGFFIFFAVEGLLFFLGNNDLIKVNGAVLNHEHPLIVLTMLVFWPLVFFIGLYLLTKD
jgi:hypothetical protein